MFYCLKGFQIVVIVLLFLYMMKTIRASNRYLTRSDGLRITYDPYSPEMIAKYGAPGETDNEGFNPYADSVGPGIYGGRIKRDSEGNPLIGEQYQNHNTEPGPIYAGGGYTPMTKALRLGSKEIEKLLLKFPDLVNEISTGGATPLHMCGMGRDNELSTEYIISQGGDIEAIDTYGYKPIHRMASNNLAIGAEALLKAGADVFARTSRKETPISIARAAGAYEVSQVIMKYMDKKRQEPEMNEK